MRIRTTAAAAETVLAPMVQVMLMPAAFAGKVMVAHFGGTARKTVIHSLEMLSIKLKIAGFR